METFKNHLSERIAIFDVASPEVKEKVFSKLIEDTKKMKGKKMIWRGFSDFSKEPISLVSSFRQTKDWYGMKILSDDQRRIVYDILEHFSIKDPVFVYDSSMVENTKTFGEPKIVVPVGGYRMVANKNIKDILVYVRQYKTNSPELIKDYKEIKEPMGHHETIMTVKKYWIIDHDVLAQMAEHIGYGRKVHNEYGILSYDMVIQILEGYSHVEGSIFSK